VSRAVQTLHQRERMDRHRFTVELEIDLSHPSEGSPSTASQRWHAAVAEEPSLRIYGSSRSEALTKAKAVALRRMADRLEDEYLHDPR
jgi:hypothetical protein